MTKLIECLENKNANYILPFFWQHGEDDATLRREIKAIDDSGIKALCVESRTHEQFCEDGWWHTLDVIFDECKKRGMKVWILDDKHFPSGYANGIIPKKYPDQRMWGITERHMDVVGPQKDASVLYQWQTSPDDILLGIVACKRVPGSELLTGETLLLTDHLSDEMVYFDLPEGCWRIVYLLKTRSGIDKRILDYADKLTEFGGDVFIEAVYEPHYAHFKQEFGKTLAGFFSDEPMFGNNTAMNFRASFGRRYSHFPYSDEVLTLLGDRFADPIRLLPALWFDTTDTTMERIRLAYMDIITALYSKNFTYKLGDWCRAHGVEYIGHVIEDDEQHTGTESSAGHFFRALDGQDMAGIDVVLCQIVPGMTDDINTVPCSYDTAKPDFFHFTLPKLGSSHAHIQRLKKGRAMCEIYGAYGWVEGLKMMKWLTDLMLVRGINTFVPHAYTPKFPDYDCPPHMYADGQNPQFKKFKLLMDYMNRVCHFINGGVHIPSAAILYHAEAEWANGSQPDAFMRVNTLTRYLTEHLLDYDIVPTDYLLDAAVENEKLCLAEEQYPCLIVPASRSLPQATIKALVRLSDAGLPVYLIGEDPVVSETGEAVEFAAHGIMSRSVASLDETLRAAGFGDLAANKPERFLRFYHYVQGSSHTYLVTNENIHTAIDCTVRVSAFSGGEYAVYDAFANTAVKASSENGDIALHLDPYESKLLIFGDLPPLEMEQPTELSRVIEPKLTWAIATATATEADYPNFTPYRATDTLFNVTGRDALPRFSGHMKYETTLALPQSVPGERVVLDLGAVGESVSLSVNGKPAGDRIVPPYRFDITDLMSAGDNAITVEVTNHLGYQMRDGFSKFLMFEPSGLLGPVTVEIRK